MEVKDILFMNKGDGENSYSKNAALITQKVAAMIWPILQEAAQDVLTENSSMSTQRGVFNVADLGCAWGPQTLEFISIMIECLVQKCNELKCQAMIPEIQFYMNDLAKNDFNTLFKQLSDLQHKYNNISWFAFGVPGSFHGRLFPRNSIHLVHSCFSVHWLSKAPKITTEGGLSLNKGKIYISKTSPLEVKRAYLSQFEEDFLSLLQFRSQELVPNGRMVLMFNGRQSTDPTNADSCYIWDLLAESLSYLASKGLIDEEKLDTFNVPYYSASQEEVQYVVDKEGSFETEFIDTTALDLGGSSPNSIIKVHRSFSESILASQFGEEVMDKLFNKAEQILTEDLKKTNSEGTKKVSVVVVLKKKEI